MLSTSRLRLRRSAAELHALTQIEREIRATDPHTRRKYLRAFADAYQTYESVLQPDELDRALLSSDVILVGDYHALPASQRYAARLVNKLAASGRPVVLGLEMIFSRDQHIIDEWLHGEIDESELRDRIRFDLDWGYEWAPVYELLCAARDSGALVRGLDCMPRGDLRRIVARDRHAAEKIVEINAEHPEAAIVVLFGESHLAPDHLPELVKRRLPMHEVLTVLQTVDPLYWHAAGEPGERVRAVRVNSDVICVFTSTPLEKYESYRLCIERWKQERPGAIDLAPTIYNLIDALLRFLNIDKYSSTNRTQPKFLVDDFPEVCHKDTLDGLRKVLVRKRAREEEIRLVLSKVEHAGSCYLARLNTMFVQRFNMTRGSEDVARFVHAACSGAVWRGEEEPQTNNVVEIKSSDDPFYARCLEEALGTFGARVLYPARPAIREHDLYALYAYSRERAEAETGFTYRDFMQMIDFLALHKDFEVNARKYWEIPELITEGRGYTGEKLEFVARHLGAVLGNRLYDAYIAARVHKRFIRSLFSRDLSRAGVAHLTYFAVVRRTSRTKRSLVA